MKREFLKELALSDDVIDQIMAENGKDIEKLKSTSQAQKTELESLKTQLSDANLQIQSFSETDIEGLKKAADDWKQKAETIEKEANTKVEALQFEHALDGALTSAKARNVKAVKALLDLDALKLLGGELVGFHEQIAKIKAENDFLFEGDKKSPQIVKPTMGASVSGDEAIRAAMLLMPK